MNKVMLTGRVAGAPEERELPSGGALVAFRLIVDRDSTSTRPLDGSNVDVIDCVARERHFRDAVINVKPNAVLSVEGQLRRRFWRAGAAAASRVEVEITAVAQ